MDTVANVDKDAAGHVSAVATPADGGADSSNGGTVAAGKKRTQEEGAATKTSGGKMEGAATITIEVLPDEILLIVLSLLDDKMLMSIVPQVSKRWRKLCPQINNVHLNFSWVGRGKKVPFEVLAGWFQQQQMQTVDGGGGGGAASAGREGWTSGMCEVFPRTTSITMGGGQGVHFSANVITCASSTP